MCANSWTMRAIDRPRARDSSTRGDGASGGDAPRADGGARAIASAARARGVTGDGRGFAPIATQH